MRLMRPIAGSNFRIRVGRYFCKPTH